jgi:hypothetical protein
MLGRLTSSAMIHSISQGQKVVNQREDLVLLASGHELRPSGLWLVRLHPSVKWDVDMPKSKDSAVSGVSKSIKSRQKKFKGPLVLPKKPLCNKN